MAEKIKEMMKMSDEIKTLKDFSFKEPFKQLENLEGEITPFDKRIFNKLVDDFFEEKGFVKKLTEKMKEKRYPQTLFPLIIALYTGAFKIGLLEHLEFINWSYDRIRK